MKIKINNETNYNTGWLRILLNRAVRMVNRRMRKKHIIRNHYNVDVVYKKSYSNWTGGYAYYNGGYVKLQVIRPPQAIIARKIESRYDMGWLRDNCTEQEIQEKKKEVEEFNQMDIDGRKERMKTLAKEIARTFIHELYHCYGYKHEDNVMFASRKKVWVEDTYNYDWTREYPVQFKVEKPEPVKIKEDIRVSRYERILDKIKEKTSILKRTQNLLKKYFAKKRYYENILIPAGKIKLKD